MENCKVTNFLLTIEKIEKITKKYEESYAFDTILYMDIEDVEESKIRRVSNTQSLHPFQLLMSFYECIK